MFLGVHFDIFNCVARQHLLLCDTTPTAATATATTTANTTTPAPAPAPTPTPTPCGEVFIKPIIVKDVEKTVCLILLCFKAILAPILVAARLAQSVVEW